MASAGGVVDAVADHRHHPAAGLQVADRGHLALGQHAGHDLVDPDLGGDRARHALVVAGEQHRLEAERRAAGVPPPPSRP